MNKRQGLLLEPQLWPYSNSEACATLDRTETHKNKVGRNILAPEKHDES